MTLEEKLKNLPVAAGVYLHKNADGKIIYVGKAKNLRNRVRQYFQSSRNQDRKTRELVRRITDFEFIVVDSEVEALVLESNLIKKHKPRFNVLLKDDKQYPHLKMTNEPFPKVVITRKILRDGASYYGPFLPANLARKTLDLINRTFQLRTCDIEIDGKLPRPCLEYHLKRCLAPCVKELCKPDEYAQAASDVKLLLEGKNKELADALQQRMWHFAETENYELAAKYRDLHKTVLALGEQQKMATTAERDVDIFGFYREGTRLALQLFTMREGKIVGRREFFWEDLDADNFSISDFLSEVLSQYYSTDYVPLEINVPADFEDREILEKALTERRGRKVRILDPKRGQKREMIALVENNAKIAFEQRFRVLQPAAQKLLEDLMEILELPHFPERIESFDISNISGAENVAGIVVYENGKPNRAEFRRLIIKSVEGANDFASMNEAVFRRYKRLLNEDKPLPQLVFIDGGKGQLTAAAAAMQALDLEGVITLVGLVKPPKRHNEISHLLRFGSEDRPIYFEMGVPAFRLVQQIRDETHRTAIQYHRKRREMRDFTSELTAIPGIGDKRKLKLLRNFGSLEKVAQASAEQLAPFVGAKAAQEIFEHFERQRKLAEN
ncbi:MAG TPA: excinuclease ABC subunit UvrC [Pyrinomonadaceae bacterium]|jgi:excinuclease ABC subunit C